MKKEIKKDNKLNNEINNTNLTETSTNKEEIIDTTLVNSDAKQIYIPKVDPKNNIYPYCIVWTQLPLISWILPFIGHTGICDSKGKIYDFAGSCTIGEENLSFGDPYKYVQLKPCKNWDKGLLLANLRYEKEDHNLFCNNCHSHVACALNNMKYNNSSKYNMIVIWWYCLVYSKYCSWIDMIKNYLPFLIFAVIYLAVKYN